MSIFGRVLTAMVTPFDANQAVDYRQAAALANYLVDHGSDGLVIAGSTGEAATLTEDERLRLFSTVLDAVGDRARVFGGTGTNDTASTLALSKKAAQEGLHGLMLVTPYYNKPSQEGLYQHFTTVAAAVDIPIILYNVPGRTAVNLLPETVKRLSESASIAAVKESCGNLEQIAELISLLPPRFPVYSGDDSLTLPILAVGGCGVISVAAHIVGPAIQQMIDAYLGGKITVAAEIHRNLLPVFKALFITTNPTAVKAAMNFCGFPVGNVRLPLVYPNKADLAKLHSVLTEAGLTEKLA